MTLLICPSIIFSTVAGVLMTSVPNVVSHTAPTDVLIVRTVGRSVEDLRPGSGGVVLAGGTPVAAFLDVADHVDAPADAPVEDRLAAAADYLRLRDFSPLQALELRLAAAQSGVTR